MKRWIAGLCCAMLVASPLVLAQAPGPESKQKTGQKKELTEKQKAHQQKMRDCSQQASERKLKGDERKTFMSQCLKA
jgi:hypothetical protein